MSAPIGRQCHVGHAYTAQVLLDNRDEDVENAIWAAIRALQERAGLLERMAHNEQASGKTRAAASYEERAQESRNQAERIRRLLRLAEHSPA